MQVSLFKINPDTIILNVPTNIRTDYRIIATGQVPLILTAEYVGQGGINIIGQNTFTHNVNKTPDDLSDGILVKISINPATTLSPRIKLTCKDNHGNTVTSEKPIFIPVDFLLTNFDKLHINNFAGSKTKAYKLLKDSGFQYNNSTKLWKK